MDFLCHHNKLFDVYRFYLLSLVSVSQMHQVVLNVHQQFHAVTFVVALYLGKNAFKIAGYLLSLSNFLL